tara:strand:- start:58 stop:303 length:246 start_codon:yes stop_codon:yes gene_type:complete
MIKIIILAICLIMLILILSKKIAKNLFTSRIKKNLFYASLLLLSITSIFLIRSMSLNDHTGKYTPPKFDGKVVIPGKITDE